MSWLPFINPFYLAFWLYPPVTIYIGTKRKSWKFILVSFLLFVIFGTGLILFGLAFYYTSLGWLIDHTENPPQEWIDNWQSDGAKYLGAGAIGWLVSLVYYLFWLPLALFIKMPELIKR